MQTHHEQRQERARRSFWNRIVLQLCSIRVRLTLWYVATTAAALVLWAGLLYSTLAKTLPIPDQLPKIAQQIVLMALAMLLFITGGGYWLASRAMRPVRLITRTAQQIGRANLSQRFHLKRRDELGELADTFDEMLNRLEAVLSRQRQFTADASHELRTPLSILSVATSRALSQQPVPENYEQALASIETYRQEFAIIQAETDHLTRLVNDLLFLARADTEQAMLASARLDMSEIVLEVVERCAPLAKERGIELVLGELPELYVCGDRLLLALLMTNLIDNALKYTAGIGSRVLVEGSVVRRGEMVWGRIGIVDDGPGIAEEHQRHLFERFYRVDRARSHASSQWGEETTSGSGLGLSIVAWVAQVHQGEVHLHSALGSGSCFEVWLPLVSPGETLPFEARGEPGVPSPPGDL